MTEEKKASPNDQPRVLIQRVDSGPQPMYFSSSIARTYGASVGWSVERDDATVLTQERADELLASVLMSDAPSCKVVQL